MSELTARIELQRTMSLTDVETSSLIRDVVERDLTVPADRSKHRFFLNSPKHDLVLPSLTRFDQDFRKFLLSVLADFALLKELERAKCLNWCPVLPKFLALLTLADGNCLMNAASLSMWAINDRRLTLRKSVYQLLVEDQTGAFKYRWQLECAKSLEDNHGSPVKCSEEEWNADWKNTVELASTRMSTDTNCFSGLEEIHVFVLANVLRRPIVVVCDDIFRGNCDESLAKVNMGGIYLPLLSDSVECVKSPLVIGYHQGHFTALVTTEDGSIDVSSEEEVWRGRNKNAVPLVKNDGSEMKVHFLLQEERQHSDRLLREYLNCSKVEYVEDGDSKTILVAVMQSHEPEAHLNQMFKTYFDALQAMYLEVLTEKMYSASHRQGQDYQSTAMATNTPQISSHSAGSPPEPCCSEHKKCTTAGCKYFTTQSHGLCFRCQEDESKKCRTPGCEFKGSCDHQGMCSVCYARYHAILEQGKSTPRPTAPPANFCRTENCQGQANPNLHSWCMNCYLSAIQHMNAEQMTTSFAVNHKVHNPTAETVTSPPGSTVSSKKPLHLPYHGTPGNKMPSPETVTPTRFTRQVSLFCHNQNCRNELEDSESLYCNYCMEHMAASMPSPEKCKYPGCTSVINHGEPSELCISCRSNFQMASGGQQPTGKPNTSSSVFSVCKVSGCAMPAITYHGELCLAHYKQSESIYRSQQFRNSCDHSHGKPSESQGTLCINTGCPYYGNAESNYLCSHCHSKALEELYDVQRIKREQERAQLEWFAQNSQMPSSWSANRTAQLGQMYHQQCDSRAQPAPRKPFYLEQASPSGRRSNSVPTSPNPQKRWTVPTIPCITQGCAHFGTADNGGLCNVCRKGRNRIGSSP